MLGSNYIDRFRKNIFVQALGRLSKDHGFEHAGYMAFLNLFSVLPLFIILVSFMTLVYETDTGIQVIRSILKLLPDYALSVVGPQIDYIFTRPSIHLISFVSLGAIWTTSSSLEGMRTIFNKIYRVKDKPSFLITRITSILQFLLLIIVTLLAIAAFIILPKIITKVETTLNYTLPNIENYYYTNTILMWLTALAVVSIVYYSLTNKKLLILEVVPGAGLTLFLWYLSSKLLAYYILKLANFNIVYGSLTGVIITLLFFYMINLILIYGAVINYLFKQRHPVAFSIYIKYCKRTLKPFKSKKNR